MGNDGRRRQQQEEEALQVGGARKVEANVNGKHAIGFWWCSSAQTKKRRTFSGRMRSRKDFERI